MYNVDTPSRSELPSSRTLLRSTLIAAGVAAVLLVAVVLPAEYGVDPTGIGRVLGLTEMGEIKMELAREAEAADAAAIGSAPAPAAAAPAAASAPVSAGAAVADTAAATTAAATSDETTITLNPGQGREIKVEMREGARVAYLWTVDGGVVNSDTHGDRPGLAYHGYAKGTAQSSDEGTLVAAFDGMHGWFWRNRGREPVTVTLRTRGDYSNLHEVE